MAEIVNLRQARKDRARAGKRAMGAENAARSGRSKALRALEEARAEKDRTDLDAHRRDRDTPEDGGA